MGYFQTALRGIKWMAALRVSTRGLVIVKTAILARILLPSQFGIYGIATIVLGFLETLTETGINIFLIQKKENVDDYVDSAWVVSVVRGMLISFAIFIFAPFIANFFNSPNSISILYLTSIVPLIRGFINPACVKFQKRLQFNKQFYYEASLFFIDTLIAVLLAFLTRSENSLVWGMIIATSIEVILSFLIFSPKPKFLLNLAKVKEVVGKGKWITGASIFNYLFENVDDIFVGRLLGTQSLGFYQQAYKVASIPASEVGEVFNKVTFPVYTAIGGDIKRVKTAFLKTLLVITTFVALFGAFVFYYPVQIIMIILGNNWLFAVPILQILAIYGVIKAISNSFFSLFLGIEKQKIVTLTTFIRALVLGIVIYPLITIFGILGAGYAAIIATLSSLPILTYFTWKYLR
ncbi:MAG: lipopolysaccharide biosynthesis protein [Patescibacteria group bacterium]